MTASYASATVAAIVAALSNAGLDAYPSAGRGVLCQAGGGAAPFSVADELIAAVGAQCSQFFPNRLGFEGPIDVVQMPAPPSRRHGSVITHVTRSAIARWRGESGDPVGAYGDLEKLLKDCMHILGPRHPQTAAVEHEIEYWRARRDSSG